MLVGGCWSSASFLGVVGGRGGGGFLPSSVCMLVISGFRGRWEMGVEDDGFRDCGEGCVGCEESFDKWGAVVLSGVEVGGGRSFLPDSA